jgi:hypothetical protein
VTRDSFFSRIQTWFSGKFHGRYLAYVLAEIGKHHPKLVSELICRSCNIPKRSLRKPVLVPEYAFQGRSGRRRADLAIFADDDSEYPVVLVEIKYRDRLLPADKIRPAQLEDYKYWRSLGADRRLLILSRETLTVPDVPALTWTQAAKLMRHHAARSDLVKALIEYLKEEGVVMQDIKPRALVGFFKRMLCSPNGAGQQVGNLDGPQEFAALLRNVKLLSARFNGDVKNAWKNAGEKHKRNEDPTGTKDASIDFEVAGRLNPKAKPDKSGNLKPSARAGGAVSVFARHSLGSGKSWLRIGYGFYMEIDRSTSHEKKNYPKTYIYAWASSREFLNDNRIYGQKEISSFEMITSKAEDSMDKVELLASKQLEVILQKLKSTAKTLTPKQKMAVSLLLKSVAERRA